jgi:histidine ammonia-lyase
MDFRAPHKSTSKIETAKAMIRAEVTFYEEDRYFTDDIEKAMAMVRSGLYNQFVNKDLVPSF